MTVRKRFEPELNKTYELKLLFNDCVSGQSKHGEYHLFAVAIGDEEYSYFPTDEVFEQIKHLRKNDSFSLCKFAAQRGNKLVTSYDVKLIGKEVKQPVVQTAEENIPDAAHDTFFSLMLQSYRDALEISGELNGMADPEKIAVTLFIARSKQSNY